MAGEMAALRLENEQLAFAASLMEKTLEVPDCVLAAPRPPPCFVYFACFEGQCQSPRLRCCRCCRWALTAALHERPSHARPSPPPPAAPPCPAAVPAGCAAPGSAPARGSAHHPPTGQPAGSWRRRRRRRGRRQPAPALARAAAAAPGRDAALCGAAAGLRAPRLRGRLPDERRRRRRAGRDRRRLGPCSRGRAGGRHRADSGLAGLASRGPQQRRLGAAGGRRPAPAPAAVAAGSPASGAASDSRRWLGHPRHPARHRRRQQAQRSAPPPRHLSPTRRRLPPAASGARGKPAAAEAGSGGRRLGRAGRPASHRRWGRRRSHLPGLGSAGAGAVSSRQPGPSVQLCPRRLSASRCPGAGAAGGGGAAAKRPRSQASRRGGPPAVGGDCAGVGWCCGKRFCDSRGGLRLFCR